MKGYLREGWIWDIMQPQQETPVNPTTLADWLWWQIMIKLAGELKELYPCSLNLGHQRNLCKGLSLHRQNCSDGQSLIIVFKSIPLVSDKSGHSITHPTQILSISWLTKELGQTLWSSAKFREKKGYLKRGLVVS